MTDAEKLILFLSSSGEKEKKLALAESCTAGLIADLLAQVPGASKILWGSFVCYTISAKIKMLGISEDLIKRYGAVSKETACAMARGALEKSEADIAISITGLAGPQGDNSEVPVGTIWIGIALKEEVFAKKFNFAGSRNDVRKKSAETAIKELLAYLQV